jgi:DNA-binding MarR family transcriptional regulator
MARKARTRRDPARATNVDDDVAGAVMVASRALVGVAAHSLVAMEPYVTLLQYRALVLLGSRGDQNVGALAEALEIHPSTATRLCDRLLLKGMIERSPSAENRREVTVTLTPAGHALVRAVTTRRWREIRRIVGRLDRATQRKVVEAFSAFASAAGEESEDAWKLGWVE